MNQSYPKHKLKFYLDSDTYINTIKEEGKRSKYSDTFLIRCNSFKKIKIIIILSDLLISEVIGVSKSQNLNPNNFWINKLIENNQIEYIKPTKEEYELAKELCLEHYKDMLHYILAIRINADYIITNNIIHFRLIQNLYHNKFTNIKKVPYKTPKEGIKIINNI